ncbi:MAG: hypothetical protein EOP04_07945 [Proteobacteria bacterium]|nr:MAG: hypothetical protein EOP04_07945 [Pseudomonadota bacterium]
MYLLSASISHILENSDTAPNALRDMYEAFKAHNKKYSMQYFCRKIGISSKGYFSFMLNGKRPIAKHFWQKLCDAFKLSEPQSKSLMEIFETEKRRCNVKTRLK